VGWRLEKIQREAADQVGGLRSAALVAPIDNQL
jgi:hypothetical protein